MEHFRHFPQIEYSNVMHTNIMVRGIIRKYIQEQKALYYEYTIPDGMRPDVLSKEYYGNSRYTWVIFYANEIIDPLSEWPLSDREFKKYIISKYGSVEKSQTYIHHYLLDDKYIIDQSTYEDGTIDFNRKKIVTCYDNEFSINEQKRNIKIIDDIYVKQITNELKVLYN